MFTSNPIKGVVVERVTAEAIVVVVVVITALILIFIPIVISVIEGACRWW